MIDIPKIIFTKEEEKRREREAAKMRMNGYSKNFIRKELRMSPHTLDNALKRFKIK